MKKNNSIYLHHLALMFAMIPCIFYGFYLLNGMALTIGYAPSNELLTVEYNPKLNWLTFVEAIIYFPASILVAKWAWFEVVLYSALSVTSLAVILVAGKKMKAQISLNKSLNYLFKILIGISYLVLTLFLIKMVMQFGNNWVMLSLMVAAPILAIYNLFKSNLKPSKSILILIVSGASFLFELLTYSYFAPRL